jgi:methylglutaconyl-CoA hydratase
MNQAAFVQLESRGPVAVLTINRPDRRNALATQVVAELGDTLDRARYDPAIRALVLTGAGPVFSAGMDLKEAHEARAKGDAEHERAAIAAAQALADLYVQVHDCPKPVIAALNGDAFAGGAGLAMACDLVIAADNARLGFPEVKRGLVAAIVMHDLVRLVGDRRARQLLLTGEPIDAIEAERWGLVNRVVPRHSSLDAAVALGQSLVACGPIALATTKKQLDEATRRSHDLRGAAAISAAIRVSEEATEGIAAFVEKRPPLWARQDDSTRHYHEDTR